MSIKTSSALTDVTPPHYYSLEYLPIILELMKAKLERCLELHSALQNCEQSVELAEVQKFEEECHHQLEIYQKASFNWRAQPELTTRQQDWLTSLRMIMILFRKKLLLLNTAQVCFSD